MAQGPAIRASGAACEKVAVPAVTVCCRQLRLHHQTEVVGTTPAERAWLRAEPITAAVRSCEPLCTPAANVSYPGGAARWPSRWALGPPG